MTRKAIFHSDSGRWHIVEGQDTIACVYSCGDYRKERAEAHVLAAAHEMLDALHIATSLTLDDADPAHKAFARRAVAAISKATKRV
jgi:hypothetical protein